MSYRKFNRFIRGCLFSGINEDIGGIVAGNNAGLRTVNGIIARGAETVPPLTRISFRSGGRSCRSPSRIESSTCCSSTILKLISIKIAGNIREALFLRRGCGVVPGVGIGRIRGCGRGIRDAAEEETSVIGDGKIS